MTDPTTRVRAILDAATPGPWTTTELESRDTGCSGHQHAADIFGRWYVRTEEGGYPGADLSGRRAEADARAIVLSRNLLPAALDVVEAARALDDWVFQKAGSPVWPVRRDNLRAALDAWDAAVKEAT